MIEISAARSRQVVLARGNPDDQSKHLLPPTEAPASLYARAPRKARVAPYSNAAALPASTGPRGRTETIAVTSARQCPTAIARPSTRSPAASNSSPDRRHCSQCSACDKRARTRKRVGALKSNPALRSSSRQWVAWHGRDRSRSIGPREGEEVRFAADSSLEGDGFGLTAVSDYPKNPKIPPFSVW